MPTDAKVRLLGAFLAACTSWSSVWYGDSLPSTSVLGILEK